MTTEQNSTQPNRSQFDQGCKNLGAFSLILYQLTKLAEGMGLITSETAKKLLMAETGGMLIGTFPDARRNYEAVVSRPLMASLSEEIKTDMASRVHHQNSEQYREDSSCCS